ncbi:MAG: NosD domain-containing protein [Deferrisomatales bacterium]|nr:NosD domain-containing protein [Deferrisomatales bacterium]
MYQMRSRVFLPPRTGTAYVASLLLLFLSASGAAAQPSRGELVLTSDTVWAGEVAINGQVLVAADATLLIMPGTTVRFEAIPDSSPTEKAGLVIHGRLLAQGREDSPILLTSSSNTPRPADWSGIAFEAPRQPVSRISWGRIEHAAEGVRVSASSVLIEDWEFSGNLAGFVGLRQISGGVFRGRFSGNETGLHFQQSQGFRVENCRVTENKRAGLILTSGSSVGIKNCDIKKNIEIGIACLQGSSPIVEGNLVQGHQRGMFVELKSNPAIYRNDIIENEVGVWAEKLVFPKIFENRFDRNGIGIYLNFSAYADIRGNNLGGNEKYALVLGDNMTIAVEKMIPFRTQGRFFQEAPEREDLPPQTRKFSPFQGREDGVVDARENWWGEVATAQMGSLGEQGNADVIQDYFDKPETEYLGRTYQRDRVAFAPWEEGPNAGAGRPQQEYSGIRGKVSFGGKPLAGVRVHVYPAAEGDFRGEGLTFSAPTGAGGEFTLHLAPGSYFLVAKKAGTPFPKLDPGPGEWFGYYGGNPVLVSAGAFREANVVVIQRAAAIEGAVSGGEGGAQLSGVVRGPEGPEEGAYLHIYPDASRRFRGPDLFGPQGPVLGGTGIDGRFSVEVPPGTYYLVASKRQGGSALGPLAVGDLYGYYDGNPVSLQQGRALDVTIQVAEKLRDPLVAGEAKGLRGIRGVIRDPSGKAAPGVYAYASESPNLMTGMMPPFRSEPVSRDGGYFIALQEPGTYYVGARSGYGGPPLPGEWFGFHGQDQPAAVPVGVGGTVPQVDITVRQME